MKKSGSFLMIPALGLILVGPIQAADDTTAMPAGAASGTTTTSVPTAGSSAALDAEHTGLTRASRLIGMKVRNNQNEALGSIQDLALDPASGKVSYVALSVGDFLGMGGRLVAVPMTSLSQQPGQQDLVLDIDKASLQAAPSFDKDSWPAQADAGWLTAATKTAGVAGSPRVEAATATDAMKLQITNPMPHNMNIVADWGQGEQNLGAVPANSSRIFDVNSPAGTEIKLTATDDAKTHSPTGTIKVDPGSPASWTIQ